MNVALYRSRVAGDTSQGSVQDLVAAGTIKLEPVTTVTLPRRPNGWAGRPMSAALQMTATAPLLEVNNIEVVYNDVILVLRGLSLAVPQGKIVALLGANGAGKSTT